MYKWSFLLCIYIIDHLLMLLVKCLGVLVCILMNKSIDVFSYLN